MNDQPTGRRFSHVYLVRGTPKKDSKKARFRLAKLAEASCLPAKTSRHRSSFDYNEKAQKMIERELGIQFGTRSTNGNLIQSWNWYFKKISVTEMLDTITVISESLHSNFDKNEKKSNYLK